MPSIMRNVDPGIARARAVPCSRPKIGSSAPWTINVGTSRILSPSVRSAESAKARLRLDAFAGRSS